MLRSQPTASALLLLLLTAGACSQNTRYAFLNRLGYGSAEEVSQYYAAMTDAPPEATLREWMRSRCFDTSQKFAFYYNPTDLGLGREVRCAQCAQGRISCVVSNHGTPMGIELAQGKSRAEASAKSLLAVDKYVAKEARADGFFDPRNPPPSGPEFRGASVAMDYDPARVADERVRFYIYDFENPEQLTPPNRVPAGLIPQLQLDNEGVKSIRNCMNCHGGSYDEARNVIVGASFLDLNVPLMQFGPDDSPRTSRTANLDRMRTINQLVMNTDPAIGIQERLCANYGLKYPCKTADMRSLAPRVPAGWEANPDLYHQVIDPYCATCHFSQRREFLPLFSTLRDHNLRPNLDDLRPLTFRSLTEWLNPTLQKAIRQGVCGAADMPHAEVTRLNLAADPQALPLLCPQGAVP